MIGLYKIIIFFDVGYVHVGSILYINIYTYSECTYQHFEEQKSTNIILRFPLVHYIKHKGKKSYMRNCSITALTKNIHRRNKNDSDTIIFQHNDVDINVFKA